MPLIGYKLSGEIIVCAECDNFPYDSVTIHVGDPEEDNKCASCHRTLSEISPVGGWNGD